MSHQPPISRRTFVAAAAALAVGPEVAGSPAEFAPGPLSPADPLGVRADFPAVNDQNYLNSAYITPSPRQVVDAARAFAESKATRPIPLGSMLERADQVRAQFARAVQHRRRDWGVPRGGQPGALRSRPAVYWGIVSDFAPRNQRS